MKKKTLIASGIAIAVIVLAAVVVSGSAAAQSGTKRVELQRHDLSIPGREVVQAVVNVDPGRNISQAQSSG